MKRLARYLSLLGLCAGLLSLPGCSVLAPRPDLSRFFVLVALPENPAAKLASTGPAPAASVSIGLGPIIMPPYLDRPQIVTRVGPDELRFSEVNRWAEPLEVNFIQVLSQDLAMRLGTTRIYTYPWYSTTRIDYQVEVDVQRFELLASGDAELVAHWSIADRNGKLFYASDAALTEKAASAEAAAGSAALSRALADLSSEIAVSVRKSRPLSAGHPMVLPERPPSPSQAASR